MDLQKDLIEKLEERSGGSIEVQCLFAGELFIKEGELTPVYIIKSGQCRVFLRDQLGDEVVLGTFGPGSTLGDISKLNKTVATANVIAQSNVELYLLEDHHFEQLWHISPVVSKELYSQMCSRLTNTNENLGKNVNALIQLKHQLQDKVAQQVQDIKNQNESLEHKNLELQQLMDTRDDFLNMAVHDLRSPLSVIKGYLELLSSLGCDPQAQEEILPILENNTNNMLSLVNDLLGISKLHSSNLKLEKRKLCPTELLRDEITNQSIIARQKEIKIHLQCPQDLPMVLADPRRLTEIVQNLLSNAIKFTERGKNIYVAAQEVGEGLIISIRDEGQGIPEEDLPKLFKSFEHISTKATEGEASTGLGLSIVKRLVELHNGSVSVESQLKVGSTFTVCIPIQNL